MFKNLVGLSLYSLVTRVTDEDDFAAAKLSVFTDRVRTFRHCVEKEDEDEQRVEGGGGGGHVPDGGRGGCGTLADQQAGSRRVRYGEHHSLSRSAHNLCPGE